MLFKIILFDIHKKKKIVLAEQRKYCKLFSSPQALIRKLYYRKHNTPG